MPDPHVRKLGNVIDIDSRVVPIGVDYDAVQVGDYRFDLDALEDFARLFVRASFMAGQHHGASDNDA